MVALNGAVFLSLESHETPTFWLACVVLTGSAFLGNVVGYEIGRKTGPAIFRREDSRLFRKSYVDKTMEFFTKYGARAIV